MDINLLITNHPGLEIDYGGEGPFLIRINLYNEFYGKFYSGVYTRQILIVLRQQPDGTRFP